MVLGPWNAAILGGAMGFIASSDRFRKALFGEQDENGNFIKGGLFDVMKKFIRLEITTPIRLFFKKEMIETIEANGLRLDDYKRTILGYYNGLCVVFYDKITKLASVWNDGQDESTYIGFNVDNEMIEQVKTNIASLIRLIKKKELSERKMEIVSACEGFEV
jgi:hypothetical protein